MSLTYEKLLSLSAKDVPHAYTYKSSLLYAVAIGMGRNPLDEVELDYVYERRGKQQVVPTQAVTVARQGLLMNVGIVVEKLLHGEQEVVFHRPLPIAAEILADHKVIEVFDKGAAKGLMIEVKSEIREKDSGEPLFDVYNLYYARGNGGIGGTDKPQRPPHPMPTRAPDIVRTTPTLPWQAFLYRLTGDDNVIHGDPVIARAMGFDRPILHGSCTLAIACREVLASVCNYESTRIKSFGTRFTAVMYPGETLETQIWVDGDVVSYRCRAVERNAMVLDHGKCVITAAA